MHSETAIRHHNLSTYFVSSSFPTRTRYQTISSTSSVYSSLHCSFPLPTLFSCPALARPLALSLICFSKAFFPHLVQLGFPLPHFLFAFCPLSLRVPPHLDFISVQAAIILACTPSFCEPTRPLFALPFSLKSATAPSLSFASYTPTQPNPTLHRSYSIHPYLTISRTSP